MNEIGGRLVQLRCDEDLDTQFFPRLWQAEIHRLDDRKDAMYLLTDNTVTGEEKQRISNINMESIPVCCR